MMQKEDINVPSPEEIKQKNEEDTRIDLMRKIVEKQDSSCKVYLYVYVYPNAHTHPHTQMHAHS
ncbi:endoribonuclease L-PSP family protein [Dorcoceras hygrometricum]|uniref:Endoribonuclease L-PSP family protein n=1 Tax=Dorcoceras hygrometricum TaxID=472368 RepID=A0A2Z7BL74_9LAMI|nr:endoribonuclease L-PSP family protein [Dorcoceras hygrometricum]